MKGVACFLLVCSSITGAAQAAGKPSSPNDLSTRIERDRQSHNEALAIVEVERERGRRSLCPNAMTTLAVNDCYSAELEKTNANYLKLARKLGMLLRGEDPPRTASLTERIPFDGAEEAWLSYRGLACTAAGNQYAGGTIRLSIEMGCRMTLTRHHMDELWDVYSDLGTR